MSDKLNDVLDDLAELAENEGEVSVKDVIEKVGSRGQGVFLMVPGLIGMTPLGGIPGVPTILGILVIVLGAQVLMGRQKVWVPDMVGNRSVSDDRLGRAVSKTRKPARWIDRHFGQRLESLTGTTAVRVAAALCVLFGLLMPPLEIVPFAALIPFTAVTLLGLSLTLRDGVLMAIAFTASIAALYGTWTFLPI